MIKKKKLSEGPRPAYFRELAHPFEGRKLLLPTGQSLEDCSFLDTTSLTPRRNTQGQSEGSADQIRPTPADLRSCPEKGREQSRTTKLQQRLHSHKDLPVSNQIATVNKSSLDEVRPSKVLTEHGSSVLPAGGHWRDEFKKSGVGEWTRRQVPNQGQGGRMESCMSTDRNQLDKVRPASLDDTDPDRNAGQGGGGWDTNSSSLPHDPMSPHSSRRSRADFFSISERNLAALSEPHHPLKTDTPVPSRCTPAHIQKFSQDGGSAYRIHMLPLGNGDEGQGRMSWNQIEMTSESSNDNLNAVSQAPLPGKNGNKIRRGDIPKRQARGSDAQNDRPVISGEGKSTRPTPSTDFFHGKQPAAKPNHLTASGEPGARSMVECDRQGYRECDREGDRLVVSSGGKKVPLRLIDHLEASEGRSNQEKGSGRYRDVTARVDNIHLSPHGHAAAGVSPRELDLKIRKEAARSFNPILSKEESTRTATPGEETDDDIESHPSRTGHSDSTLELSCLQRAGLCNDDTGSLSVGKAKIRRGTLTRGAREDSFSNNSSADTARQSCTPRGESDVNNQGLRVSGSNKTPFNFEPDKQVCRKSLIDLSSPGRIGRSPGSPGKEEQSSSRKGGDEAAANGKSGPTFFVVRRVVRGEGTSSSKAVDISQSQISQEVGQVRESGSTKQTSVQKVAARQADPVPNRGNQTRNSTSGLRNLAPQPSQEKAPVKKTPRIIKGRTDFSNNNHMDDFTSPPTAHYLQSQGSDHTAVDFHPSPAFSIALQNENHSNRQSTKSVKNGRGENVRSEISVSAVPQNSQSGYCFSRSGFVVDPSGLCCMEELSGILEEARVNSWKRCNAAEDVDVESLLPDPLEECLNFTFLGEYIRSLWRHEMLCDVKVVVGHKQYLVHKLVLAAYSSLFCPPTPRPEPTHVYNIPNSSPRAVEQIFSYMYSATMTLTDDMLEDVLIAAKLMGVTDVVDVIKRILSQPTLDNVELYNDIIKKSGLDISFLDQQKIYQQSFGDMKKNVAFLGIQADELHQILMDPDVLVTSEVETIEVIISWIEYNYLQRIGYLGTMLRQVSYESINPSLLVQLADKYKHIFDTQDGSVFLCEAFRYHALHCNTALNELETAIEEEKERADNFVDVFPMSTSNSRYDEEEDLREAMSAAQQTSARLDDTNRSRSRQVALALPPSKDRGQQMVLPGQNSDEFEDPSLNRSTFKSVLWGPLELKNSVFINRPTSPSASTPYINLTSRPPSPLAAPMNSGVYDSRPASSAERLPGTSRRTVEETSRIHTPSTSRYGEAHATPGAYASGLDDRESQYLSQTPEGRENNPPSDQGGRIRTIHKFVPQAENSGGSIRRKPAKKFVVHRFVSRNNNASQANQARQARGEVSGAMACGHSGKSQVDWNRNNACRMVIVEAEDDLDWERDTRDPASESRRPRNRDSRDSSSESKPFNIRDCRSHSSESINSRKRNNGRTYSELVHAKMKDTLSPSLELRKLRVMDSSNLPSELSQHKRKGIYDTSPAARQTKIGYNGGHSPGSRSGQMRDVCGRSSELSQHYVLDKGGGTSPQTIHPRKTGDEGSVSPESKQHIMRNNDYGYLESRHPNMTSRYGGSPESVQLWTKDGGGASTESLRTWEKDPGVTFSESKHPSVGDRRSSSSKSRHPRVKDVGGGCDESRHPRMRDNGGACTESGHPSVRDSGGGCDESRHPRVGDVGGGCDESRHPRMEDRGGGDSEPIFSIVNDKSEELNKSMKYMMDGEDSGCSESSETWIIEDSDGSADGKLKKEVDSSCDCSDKRGMKRARVQWATAPEVSRGFEMKPLNLSLCELGHDPTLSAFSLYRPEN